MSSSDAERKEPPPLGSARRSLLFLLLALALVAPLFTQPLAHPYSYDFRYFLSWLEAGRRSVLWFGELPLWNPWTCGGQVYLANPQSTIATPTFVLVLLFGTALGSKLMLVAYLFFALDGMYRLARDFQIDDDAARLAAVLFAGCGWFALHVSSGHLNFAGASLLPYLLLSWRRAQRQLRWVIPLGALMAWVIGLGGTTTPALSTVSLSLMALFEVLKRRSLRPLWVLLLAALAALGIGAVRLLPVLEFALRNPRITSQRDHNDLLFLLQNAVMFQGLSPVPGKPYFFHEYGWKLPWLMWPFLLYGLRWLRARWELWLLFACGLAIASGYALPGGGPWGLLKQLPLFRDLRVPTRYTLLSALAAALIVALAAQHLLASRPRRRLLMWLLFAVFSVESVAYSAWLYQRVPLLRLPPPDRHAPFFQVQSHWTAMLVDNWVNHGVIGCDEEAPLQRARQLDLGDVPQLRLQDPSAGQARLLHFSPNRLRASVELSQEAVLLLNTNWNEHWRSDVGQVEKFGDKYPHDRDGGRLAVRLPPGTYSVTLRYRPTSYVLGLWLTLLCSAAALALFFRGRRRSPQLTSG